MNDGSAWRALGAGLTGLQRRLSLAKTTNISAAALRVTAKSLVQLYFREVRPELLSLSLDGVEELDHHFQDLLRLANRVNRRTTYVRLAAAIRSSLDKIEGHRELAIGNASSRRGSQQRYAMSDTDYRLVTTLENLVPSAALSYRQALADLAEPGRLSFRGTAAELREALRETLDHLASDDDVMHSPGFKLEASQTRPTMRQKVRFILRSRGDQKAAAHTAEGAAGLVDEITAALVRSVYERASVSTHTPATAAEVRRVKSYVDNVLVDLLEL